MAQESQRSSHSLLMQQVNDRIFEILGEVGSEDVEFLCECSDRNCVETIPFTLGEYATLQRVEERPLLKVAGHPD